MGTSSVVRKFIESIPPNELYEEQLRDLAKSAGQLAFDEPRLAYQFLLIQNNFNALADHWEGEALDVVVSREITPLVRESVRGALERPGQETILELASIMRWAMKSPSERNLP